MSGASAVRKQSMADVLQDRCQACNFIKKRLQYRYFPMKFAKFLRTPFFTEHLWWLLLSALKKYIFSRTVYIKKDSNISLLKKQEIMTI